VLLGLAACQSAGTAGGSPAGVPIAVDIIDGPPAPVRTALAGELVAAANAREVEIVGTGAAPRYRVRGYLSTQTGDGGGTSLAYVWDVFDVQKRRATRLSGSSPLERGSASSWTGLDRAALARLAAQSMDEIAGFLSEAKATTTADASAATLGDGGPTLAATP
jgi:hypothetical protein